MSLEYIRDYYKVPAEFGRRVEYSGGTTPKTGVIVGATNQYINIHFDGEKKPRGCYHPIDGMKYLDMGKVPRMTHSQKRYARYREVSECFDSFKAFLGYEMEERKAKKCGFNSVSEYNKWLAGPLIF